MRLAVLPCIAALLAIGSLPGCANSPPPPAARVAAELPRGTEPQPGAGGTVMDLSGYRLTFDDSFDTMDIAADGGKGRWFGPVHSGFGAAKFLPPSAGGPFIFRDGTLAIRASKVGGVWQSGLMQTVDSHGQGFTQRYGYFEIRCRLPAGAATWPAFWLYTVSRYLDPKATRGEIDVLEQSGDGPLALHNAVHLRPPGGQHWQAKHNSLALGMSDDFHLYGASVEPDWIIFYFDRHEVWRTPTPDPMKTPLYILVDLAMQNSPTLANATDPSDMQIDYVRAYERKDE